MAKQDDGLFLFEVLVDKIIFSKSPCFSDKDFRTCVNIECPSVDPLEICDDDPGACVATSGGPFVKNFNSGKSCLFSLKQVDISKAMSKFPINISVYKSLPCGCLPTKIILGEATIDMTKEFVEARKKFLDDPANVSYQALKDSFRIVGPDGEETGEVLMFLRISCFGKLIVTRFQGGSDPPKLGSTGEKSPYIMDRSCNPKKSFQTPDDPCACGVAKMAACHSGLTGRSSEFGVYPVAVTKNEHSPPLTHIGSTPHMPQSQMACRNTDQYCLHVPKGTLPSLPHYQELSEEQKLELKSTNTQMTQQRLGNNIIINLVSQTNSEAVKQQPITQTFSSRFLFKPVLPFLLQSSISSSTNLSSIDSFTSISSSHTETFKDFVIFDNGIKNLRKTCNVEFGKKHTAVYNMTLLNNFCQHCTSGTQATASINKCLQVRCNTTPSTYCMQPYYDSKKETNDVMSLVEQDHPEQLLCPNIYFFGHRKRVSLRSGMGSTHSSETEFKHHNKQKQPPKIVGNSSTQAKTSNNNISAQTKAKGSSVSTNTMKVVSIKDTKKGNAGPTIVEANVQDKEKIETVALSGEEQGPVRITTISNPRRGVFELVIRRLTGAPLAKNELMLEWTPPPSRLPLKESMGPIVVEPGQTIKCKTVVCHPVCCKPKCYKKTSKKPCRPIPCRILPCKKSCRSICHGISCRSCKPCPPQPSSPCKSSPSYPCKPCSLSTCKPCPLYPWKPCPPYPCKSCPPYPCKPCPPYPCKSCSPFPCKPSPSRPCKPCPPYPCKPYPPYSCKPCPIYPCKPCPPYPCKPCPPYPCKPCPIYPCKPCPPYPCKPCPPSPCKSVNSPPCCSLPCNVPCKSSPCLRPCPVRYKKPHKIRSQPKMKPRRKRISPCKNKSIKCPVVRCRSLPGPCILCCPAPQCFPRKCCSIARPSCKPPHCCKSDCSTFCT